MYCGRPWEAPGSPKTLPKTMQKFIRTNYGKIGMQVLASHAGFFGWERGAPYKIPAGSRPGTGKQAPGLQGQGNRLQGYRKPV